MRQLLPCEPVLRQDFYYFIDLEDLSHGYRTCSLFLLRQILCEIKSTSHWRENVCGLGQVFPVFPLVFPSSLVCVNEWRDRLGKFLCAMVLTLPMPNLQTLFPSIKIDIGD